MIRPSHRVMPARDRPGAAVPELAGAPASSGGRRRRARAGCVRCRRWRSLGDSNPCPRRERAVSWATRRRERRAKGMDWRWAGIIRSVTGRSTACPTAPVRYHLKPCRGRKHHHSAHRHSLDGARHLRSRRQRGSSQSPGNLDRRRPRGLSRRRRRSRPAARPETEGFRRRDRRDAGDRSQAVQKLPPHRTPVPPRARAHGPRDHRGGDVPGAPRRIRQGPGSHARRRSHRARQRLRHPRG